MWMGMKMGLFDRGRRFSGRVVVLQLAGWLVQRFGVIPLIIPVPRGFWWLSVAPFLPLRTI